MNKNKVRLHKRLADILCDSDNIQYLMYILDKYFEQEMEHSISVERIYQLFNYILKKHAKIITKIDNLNTII